MAPPAETLVRARDAAALCGVTRLADVTGLDVIGIPVFQAVRPAALSLSVSQGKGATRVAARVSALMEAVELHCAELARPDHHGAGDPADRAFADAAGASPDATAWHAGVDLLARRPLRVPHDLVSMDFTRPEAEIGATSNGLASGNDETEASVAALAEIFERDAHAAWLARTAAERAATAIAPESVDDRLGRLLLRMVRDAGLGTRLWDMSAARGPATIGCAIYDLGAGIASAMPPAFGAGTHPSARVALARAVTEAAQSRVTMIAGSRDDLTPRDYRDAGIERLRLLLGTGAYAPAARSWRQVPDRDRDDVTDDLAWLLDRAAAAGARWVARVELAAPVGGLAVVKIVVPGFGDPHR